MQIWLIFRIFASIRTRNKQSQPKIKYTCLAWIFQFYIYSSTMSSDIVFHLMLSSCKGVQPRFLALWSKRRGFHSVCSFLHLFFCSVVTSITFSSNLSNFENIPKRSHFFFKWIKKIQKILKSQKSIKIQNNLKKCRNLCLKKICIKKLQNCQKTQKKTVKQFKNLENLKNPCLALTNLIFSKIFCQQKYYSVSFAN